MNGVNLNGAQLNGAQLNRVQSFVSNCTCPFATCLIVLCPSEGHSLHHLPNQSHSMR